VFRVLDKDVPLSIVSAIFTTTVNTMAISLRPQGIAVAQLAIARGVSFDDVAAQAFAEARGWTEVVHMMKTATTASTTTEWAGAAGPVTSGFIAATRPLTITGRLALRAAALNTRLVIGTGTSVGGFVFENEPEPVLEGSFSEVTLLPRRMVTTSVVTKDLLLLSVPGAEEVVLGELKRALVHAEDAAFIDNSALGSITIGAPTITSTGATIAAIDTDLKATLQVAFNADIPLLAPAWVMHPQTATYLASLRGTAGPAYPSINVKGGSLLGIPVLTSTAVARHGSPGETFITLLDASEILYADSGAADIEVARHAAVEMSDTPTGGAQNLRSLWQNNMVALRIQRWLAWRVMRSGAVVVLDGITY